MALTFDLQNVIRSSVAANEYFLQVSLRLLKLFLTYHGNKVCSDERTDEQTYAADGQPLNIASAEAVW